VRGYSHQLRALLDSLPQSPSGAPLPDLSHLRGVADALNDEVKKLKTLELDFQAECQGRTDAEGRPKISKIKWARHLGALDELRGRVSQWKQDLSHAVALFQTTVTVDIRNVVITRFHEIDLSAQRSEAAIISSLKSEFTQSAGAIMSDLKDNAIQCATLLERASELKEIATRVESILTKGNQGGGIYPEVASELRTLIQKLDPRDDNLRRDITNMQSTLRELSDLLKLNNQSTRCLEQQLGQLVLSSGSDEAATGRQAQLHSDSPGSGPQRTSTLISVQTTLNTGRRCKSSCNCQCHKSTTIRSPGGLLSNILGHVLLAYNGISFRGPRTCDHPKCGRNSPNRFRLTYMFPRWIAGTCSVTGLGQPHRHRS
jgi:hypothetical protein